VAVERAVRSVADTISCSARAAFVRAPYVGDSNRSTRSVMVEINAELKVVL
jgi:hypothetical protein